MIKDKLQIYTLSVVLVGDFNPVIINPFWLAQKGLIKEQEAANAKVELIHNDLTRFDIGWAHIEITQNRFEIRSSQEPFFNPIKDLVTSIFSKLSETPIKLLGINHIKHFQFDHEQYYNFGNKLAPLANWDFLNEPKVVYLEIMDLNRKDGQKGSYRVKIEPSNEIKPGVVINTNDTYQLSEESKGRNGEIMQILINSWSNSIKVADETPEEIWKKINA